MFTGIIEAVGSVRKLAEKQGDLYVCIATGGLDMADVQLGDSIAVNGVCLTVVAYGADWFEADISNETRHHTRWNDIQLGESVNLEKAMLPTTRLGGHLVSGHVDEVGVIQTLSRDARSIRIKVSMGKDIARYVAKKGSITVDGVSLTANDVGDDWFELNIVPHTADETIISRYQVGQKVHLEIDLIARYVERLLQPQTSGAVDSRITPEFLARNGFWK